MHASHGRCLGVDPIKLQLLTPTRHSSIMPLTQGMMINPPPPFNTKPPLGRFLGCLSARHELVLLQDDDVLLTEAAITALVAAKRSTPAAPLVGFFGRDWGNQPHPGYVMAEVSPGHHPIALTVSVLVSRGLCRTFFDYSPLAEPFVRTHSSPYWNGGESLATTRSG